MTEATNSGFAMTPAEKIALANRAAELLVERIEELPKQNA